MTQEFDSSDRIILIVRPALADEISLSECAERTGASIELLERLIEEEIIHATRVDSEQRYFSRPEFEIIERSLRLHHELGVNLAGIVIIEHLLEQLRENREPRNEPSADAEFEPGGD